MIRKVEGYSRYVAIAGLREVEVGDVERFLASVKEKLHNVTVQFFDARIVAGWQHLYFATLDAIKAFENQTNISKNLAVECLLYASAQRQIKAALDLVGIKRNSSAIAVLIIGDNEKIAGDALKKVENLIHGKREDSVIDLSKEKMTYVRDLFGISDVELAAKLEDDEGKALSDLVIEHMALLVTQR